MAASALGIAPLAPLESARARPLEDHFGCNKCVRPRFKNCRQSKQIEREKLNWRKARTQIAKWLERCLLQFGIFFKLFSLSLCSFNSNHLNLLVSNSPRKRAGTFHRDCRRLAKPISISVCSGDWKMMHVNIVSGRSEKLNAVAVCVRFAAGRLARLSGALSRTRRRSSSLWKASKFRPCSLSLKFKRLNRPTKGISLFINCRTSCNQKSSKNSPNNESLYALNKRQIA